MSNKDRIEVLKTYKMYIGGKFPRTESGHYYKVLDGKGELLANACSATRKDFRESVKAARSAFGKWAGASAYNRGQVVYRIAEMLETRKAQFEAELMSQGTTKAAAEKEVQSSIDRLVYYAGWSDKFQQIFSSVNPVASSHFNFSMLQPMGVIALFAPEKSSLLGLISAITPAIVGGNSVVVLASEKSPLAAVTFAELLATSDVPCGVVNILTGKRSDLISHFSSHMDVNACVTYGASSADKKVIQHNAADNMKRAIFHSANVTSANAANPYLIRELQETKTTWHPIEVGQASGAAY